MDGAELPDWLRAARRRARQHPRRAAPRRSRAATPTPRSALIGAAVALLGDARQRSPRAARWPPRRSPLDGGPPELRMSARQRRRRSSPASRATSPRPSALFEESLALAAPTAARATEARAEQQPRDPRDVRGRLRDGDPPLRGGRGDLARDRRRRARSACCCRTSASPTTAPGNRERAIALLEESLVDARARPTIRALVIVAPSAASRASLLDTDRERARALLRESARSARTRSATSTGSSTASRPRRRWPPTRATGARLWGAADALRAAAGAIRQPDEVGVRRARWRPACAPRSAPRRSPLPSARARSSHKAAPSRSPCSSFRGVMEFAILGPLRVSGPDGPDRDQRAQAARAARDAAARAPPGRGLGRAADRRAVGRAPARHGQQGAAGADLAAAARARRRTRSSPAPAGYAIALDDGALDLQRFEALVAQARDAPRRPRRAELLREALALFRGAAAGRRAAARARPSIEADRLAGARLDALEQRIEHDLALGRHAEVVARARRRSPPSTPYRERLHAQLMLALYRSGRQADALEAYRRARHALVEDLGLDPSPELKRLEAAILSQDPALELERDRAAAGTGAAPRPSAAAAAPADAAARPRGGPRDRRRAARATRDVRLLTLTGPGRDRQVALRARARAPARPAVRRRRPLRRARRGLEDPALVRDRDRRRRSAPARARPPPCWRATRCCW